MTVVAPPRVVRRASRLHGRIDPPADKSIAHRALIVNALADGEAVVEARAPGHDVLSTAACLRTLGVEVGEAADGRVTRFAVSGTPSRDASVDCGNSGTTMRLLAGAMAGLPHRVTLDGDVSLRRRPMERVASLLRAAGADATTIDGRPPMTVTGRTSLRPVTHRLPAASAQLLGAAALAGLAADGETRIEAPATTRDHTERMLAAGGVSIWREGLVTILHGPTRPTPIPMRVPGDISSAAPWLVAGALAADADLRVVDVGLNPTRPAIVDLLVRIGADVTVTTREEHGPEPIGELRVRGGGALAPFEVAGGEVAALIDELPLVGVLMAVTGGEVRDAAELRVKESDRIAAMVAGLRAIGASVEERPDGWTVTPGSPREAAITTHGDHRIAIAFAVAALAGVAAGIELDDPSCVAVSYPTFWADVGEVAGS